MKKIFVFTFLVSLHILILYSFRKRNEGEAYKVYYFETMNRFKEQQVHLLDLVKSSDLSEKEECKKIQKQINYVRRYMKSTDFWLRYLDPIQYKKINGPLRVEWETEVFEKFEKPYKREGAGLTLAYLYLDEACIQKDSLINLIDNSLLATQSYFADSVTRNLFTYSHFFFSNRLFLLNLAAIYTTGFECPDENSIIVELKNMLKDVNEIYTDYNRSFPSHRLGTTYLNLYDRMINFVNQQENDFSKFDHFSFLKDYVNPLFAINQELIRKYKIYSNSFNDYSLNDASNSIFSKKLYNGQNSKGIYIAVKDTTKLNEIKEVGKLLFFDPILSGNGKRSCASCHKPDQYFTDTTISTALSFNETGHLLRNTPTLLNVTYNHLLMLDGKHISLQNQAKDVIANPNEMGCDPDKILQNVMSCEKYKNAFQKFLALTPNYDEVTLDHVVSAITLFYSAFSEFEAPFDRAMNGKERINQEAIKGFNLFMSKAQCATCHFMPQFNGVKPPYIGSEFEVIGVPADKNFNQLSKDSGRFKINPAIETLHAFRTGSIRNATFTKPYMHNGIFNTMDEVLDLYDAGGAAGKGLKLDNQTLSPDSLKLTKGEKEELKAFIKTLDENIIFPKTPNKLPDSKLDQYKNRKPGGEY